GDDLYGNVIEARRDPLQCRERGRLAAGEAVLVHQLQPRYAGVGEPRGDVFRRLAAGLPIRADGTAFLERNGGYQQHLLSPLASLRGASIRTAIPADEVREKSQAVVVTDFRMELHGDEGSGGQH